MNLSRMKDLKVTSLAQWKKEAKARGYKVAINPEARPAVQPLWVARKGEYTLGTFSERYPREAHLLID